MKAEDPTRVAGRGRFVHIWFWLAAGVCLPLSGLILVNSIPYFTFDRSQAFLVEKGVLAYDPIWSACFYLHVAGGAVCLLAGPLLLWNGLRGGSRRLHRLVGQAYATAVLGWAGPTGIYLAIYAKGGLAGQAGFLLLGLAWYTTTLFGIRALKTRRIRDHLRWMLRSYALVLSAVFFRLIHVGLFAAGVADHTNYVLSLWLSNGVSVWVGELLILRFVSRQEVDPAQDGVAMQGIS